MVKIVADGVEYKDPEQLRGKKFKSVVITETLDGEQLELFPELIKQWEEDTKWYTILRLREESEL
jgi:hypothetical protein